MEDRRLEYNKSIFDRRDEGTKKRIMDTMVHILVERLGQKRLNAVKYDRPATR